MTSLHTLSETAVEFALRRPALRRPLLTGLWNHYGADDPRDGLRLAFPELSSAEIDRLHAAYGQGTYAFTILLRSLLRSSPEEMVARANRAELRGGDTLRALAAAPEPVVFFSAHYGTPVIGALRLLSELERGGSKRLATFYQDPEVHPDNRVYVELFSRLEDRMDSILVQGPSDRRSALRALRTLRGGGALTMQPDVYDSRGRLVLVPFFGRLTFAMGGTAFFALKGGARLVPVYSYEETPGHFVVDIHPPLDVPLSGDEDHDVYALTAAIFQDMEAQLRRAPEHWTYWASLRGRTIEAPTDAPDDQAAWQAAFDKFVVRQAATPDCRELVQHLRTVAPLAA